MLLEAPKIMKRSKLQIATKAKNGHRSSRCCNKRRRIN